MSTHDPLHLFFGIKLNPELHQALSQLIEELKQEPWGKRVMWNTNLHVTLRFLGPTKPSLLPILIERSREAVKKIASFPLQLINIRFHPSPTAPRTIVAEIAAFSELFELAYALEEVAAKLGFTPETKPYLPYLILGQINHHHVPSLREELKLNIESMQIDEIILLNSKKTEYNQTYEPLECISLQKNTVKA